LLIAEIALQTPGSFPDCFHTFFGFLAPVFGSVSVEFLPFSQNFSGDTTITYTSLRLFIG
jgi:hypothetical protein